MADTGWKRLHFEQTTSSWTMVDTGTFDNGTAEHLLIYLYTNGSTNQASPFMRFNGSGENDSYGNGKYSYRSNSDMHTSDVGADAQNWIDLKGDQYGGWTMYKIHIIAKKGYDKLIWWNATRVHGNTGGDDVSGVAQWVNTTENITSIQIKEQQGDTMNAGLNILVLGSDDGTATITAKDKSSITNVPAGTRYEETDTRKIFRREVGTLGVDTGLVAAYNLNNTWNVTSGTLASGTGGDMTAQNSAAFSSSVKKTGTHSAYFASDTDLAKTSDSNGANFDWSGDSTTMVWVRRLDGIDDDYHGIISKRGSYSDFHMYLKPTTGHFQVYINNTGGTTNPSSTGTIANDTWVHIAVTITGTTMKFYINGLLDSTHTLASVSSQESNTPFAIGARSGSSEGYHGYLDQIGIWNRVLTIEEIDDIVDPTGDGENDGIPDLTVSSWKKKGTA